MVLVAIAAWFRALQRVCVVNTTLQQLDLSVGADWTISISVLANGLPLGIP
jgi:hypothetical protein